MKTINELETFFELDLRVKKIIEKARPNLYDSDPVYEEKKLINSLESAKNAINDMLNLSFYGYKDEINAKFEKIKKMIELCNYDMKSFLKVYEDYFLTLSDELIDSLQNNVYAFYVFYDPHVCLSKCNSINEILHLLHFSVINNEENLQSMNKIDDKKENDNEIVLYGKESELARDIFNKFEPNELGDDADIVSFKNHIIVMLRGRGHATTLDITEEEDKLRINYFIPKACNAKMVNELEGVTKIPEDSNSVPTHGELVINKENASNYLLDFVKRIPTDFDYPNLNDDLPIGFNF